MESPRYVHEPLPYRVLMFYRYVAVEGHEEYTACHLDFCRALGITGRVLLAHEGINGTLSGTVAQTEAYIAAMRMDPRFRDMIFKVDEVEKPAFSKLSVKAVEFLVNFGEGNAVDPNDVTGAYLDPDEFFQALTSDEVVVLDARNDYEYDLGHFRNAIKPDVHTFRDLPRWIRRNLQDKKDKKIITYCTGGIRCEKLTGFLINEGFQDVSQLRGGIVAYFHDPHLRGKYFDGKLYVFDERKTIDTASGK